MTMTKYRTIHNITTPEGVVAPGEVVELDAGSRSVATMLRDGNIVEEATYRKRNALDVEIAELNAKHEEEVAALREKHAKAAAKLDEKRGETAGDPIPQTAAQEVPGSRKADPTPKATDQGHKK